MAEEVDKLVEDPFGPGALSTAEDTVTGEVVRLRARMQFAQWKSDPTLGPFFASVPDDQIEAWYQGFAGNMLPHFEDRLAVLFPQLVGELSSDPELMAFYQETFVEGNQDRLREKSRGQLAKMFALFPAAGKSPTCIEPFRALVRGARVVNNSAEHHETLRPPVETGVYSSYGPQDVLIQAHHYVYASLDAVPHNMAKRAKNEFDRADLGGRAELVMMDVADMSHRCNGNLAAHYRNNIFDFETGEEILAAYLAYVFDTPEQAQAFISSGNMRTYVNTWDRDDWPDEYKKPEGIDTAKAREIQARMKKIHAEMGIEPPLSLEVRIRGAISPTHPQADPQ